MSPRLARIVAAAIASVGLGVVAPLGCIEVGHQTEVGCFADPNEPECPGPHFDASTKDSAPDVRRDVGIGTGDGEASTGDGSSLDASDGQREGGSTDAGNAQDAGDAQGGDAAQADAGGEDAAPAADAASDGGAAD